MRSIVSILLTAVMLLTVLTGCGKMTSQNVAASPSPSPTTAAATATPEAENALDKAEDKLDQAADKVEDKVEGAVDDMEEDRTPEEYPTNDLVGQPSPLPETEQEEDTVRSGQ